MRSMMMGASVLACACAQALAADGGDAAGERPPQRVEVVGQTPLSGAARALPVAGAAQQADAQDLRQSQAADLSDHLARRFGSVHVNEMQGNPLQVDLSFRGFTASPLLGTPQGLSVYLDGVRLNQPFGDIVSWDLIPRNAIARSTLLPGAQPAFGLNSLGGALVLETKNGREEPGGEASVQVGSGRRRVVELALGRTLGEPWDLFVSAQVFKEDGWRDASASEQGQLFAKLGWRSGPSRVSVSLAHADTDLVGNGLQEQRWLAQRWASVFTSPDLTRNHATLLSVLATHEVSPSLGLTGNAYLRRLRSGTLNGDANEGAFDQNLYFNPTAANLSALEAAGFTGMPKARETAAGTPFPAWNCRLNAVLNEEPNEKCDGLVNRTATQQSAVGLALQATLRGRWGGLPGTLTLGAGFDRSRVNFQQGSEFGIVNPDHSVTGVGVFADGTQDSENADDARVDLRNTNRTASLYAVQTLVLSPGLHLSLSGRWNRTHVAMVDLLQSEGLPGSLNGRHRFSRLNPAASLVFALGSAVGGYLGVGQASRAPTATELGCADPEDPCRLPNAMASDPPLRQVISRSLEAGLRSAPGAALRWNLGLFRSDNRDDIQFVAAPAVGTGYFRNVQKTRRQGLEAGVSGRSAALVWGLNLTLLQATFESSETLPAAANSSNDVAADGLPGLAEGGGVITVRPGDRLPLVPSRMAKAWLQWRTTPTLTLGLEAQAVSGVLARGNENGQHQADGRIFLGGGRTAGYAVAGFTAEWQLAPRLSLSGRITNLADRRYATAATLAATPYNAQGGIDARQAGSYKLADGSTGYIVRQSTFLAPGAPRQAFVTLGWQFD